jgi:branched-chain amino acid transport system ATP-binding protein
VSVLLEVRGLRSGYDGSSVLQGVDLKVEDGGVLGLFGRNGVGKTTTILTLMGMVTPRDGSIRFAGEEVLGKRPDEIARKGVGLIPQGRRVFGPLTVDENLRVASRGRRGAWTVERVYEALPQLGMRRRSRASQLSGGEQQMLAIARALLRNPRLLLLDEPSDGLAPVVVEQITAIVRELSQEGMSILMVEQELLSALAIADDVAVMDKGRIVHQASASECRADPSRLQQLLSVAGSSATFD